jgi:hypothetical protein
MFVCCCARTQVVKLQQSGAGHEVESQTQVPRSPPEPGPPPFTTPPLEQCWPGMHSAIIPHTHCWAWQSSASPASRQSRHADPPPPQAAARLPGLHCPPEQQPLGHDCASQTQVPLLHRWPGSQGEPLEPHEQAPPSVHESLRVALHTVHGPPLPQLGKACWLHTVLVP